MKNSQRKIEMEQIFKGILSFSKDNYRTNINMENRRQNSRMVFPNEKAGRKPSRDRCRRDVDVSSLDTFHNQGPDEISCPRVSATHVFRTCARVGASAKSIRRSLIMRMYTLLSNIYIYRYIYTLGCLTVHSIQRRG